MIATAAAPLYKHFYLGAQSSRENEGTGRQREGKWGKTKESAKLAKHYVNATLGDIVVSTSGPATIFDFGEWKSEVASKKNPDGTLSFVTIVPGMQGSEFVVGPDPKRTLIACDAQHEYVFEER